MKNQFFRDDLVIAHKFYRRNGDIQEQVPVPERVRLTFLTAPESGFIRVERNGDKCVGCVVSSDGMTLTASISLSRTCIGKGPLMCIIEEFRNDPAFPQGVMINSTPIRLDVVLSDTRSDDAEDITADVAFGEMTRILSEIEAAEGVRVVNENARIANENARKTSEDERNSGEQSRVAAEQDRQTKFTSWEGFIAASSEHEVERMNAEKLRESAESERASAESARVSSESARVSAEQARNTAESERASAEQLREDAEDTRASNENTRIANENARKTSEDERNSGEQSRVAAEHDRQAKFTSWEDFIAASSEHEVERMDAEKLRESAESERASAESARVSSEQARNQAETERASAEQSRKVAEQNRESKVAEIRDFNDIIKRDIGYNAAYSTIALQLGESGKYVKCSTRSAAPHSLFAISAPFDVEACSELLIKTGYNPSDAAHSAMDISVISLYEVMERQRTVQKTDSEGNLLYYAVTIDPESGSATVTTDETTEDTGYPVYTVEVYEESRYLPNNEDRFVAIPDSGYYVANIPQACKAVISYKPGTTDMNVIVVKHGALANLTSQLFGNYEHRTMVEAMASLYARVAALENSRGLIGNATAGALDALEFTRYRYPLVLYGHGVPAAANVPVNLPDGMPWDGIPVFIGQLYINLDASESGVYYATGHDAVSNWKQA